MTGLGPELACLRFLFALLFSPFFTRRIFALGKVSDRVSEREDDTTSFPRSLTVKVRSIQPGYTSSVGRGSGRCYMVSWSRRPQGSSRGQRGKSLIVSEKGGHPYFLFFWGGRAVPAGSRILFLVRSSYKGEGLGWGVSERSRAFPRFAFFLRGSRVEEMGPDKGRRKSQEWVAVVVVFLAWGASGKVVTLVEPLFAPLPPTVEERSRLGNTKHRREFQGVEGLGSGFRFFLLTWLHCLLHFTAHGVLLLLSFLRYVFPRSSGRGRGERRG